MYVKSYTVIDRKHIERMYVKCTWRVSNQYLLKCTHYLIKVYLSLPACNNPKYLNKVTLNFMLIVNQFQILLKSKYDSRLLLAEVCTFVCASRV
jgi:hypothetical protein